MPSDVQYGKDPIPEIALGVQDLPSQAFIH